MLPCTSLDVINVLLLGYNFMQQNINFHIFELHIVMLPSSSKKEAHINFNAHNEIVKSTSYYVHDMKMHRKRQMATFSHISCERSSKYHHHY